MRPIDVTAVSTSEHVVSAARGYPADRRLAWRGALVAAAAGVGAFVAFRLLARAPDAAEAFADVAPGTFAGLAVSRFTGLVPFGVAGTAATLYVAWLGATGGIAISQVVRGRRRWRNALGGGARRLLRDGGVLLCVFYALWGFNYARPTFAQRAGWPEWNGASAAELTALAWKAVEELNAAYVALHGTRDAGTPTAMPSDPRSLDAALDEGWRRATSLLSLPRAAARRYGPVKWTHQDGLLPRFGIRGVYVPFTGEAHVVRGFPAPDVPVMMAHEKAHQRGFTSEADATFLGFIAAALAPDPLSRYGAATVAFDEILRAMQRGVPQSLLAELRDALAPGVLRDAAFRQQFYRDLARRHQGVLRDVGSGVNDRYLRANNVPGGSRDYGRSAWRLITFARLNGGELLPPWPEARPVDTGDEGGA